MEQLNATISRDVSGLIMAFEEATSYSRICQVAHILSVSINESLKIKSDRNLWHTCGIATKSASISGDCLVFILITYF